MSNLGHHLNIYSRWHYWRSWKNTPLTELLSRRQGEKHVHWFLPSLTSSRSAFPATLAFQIRELEKETGGAFKLDAIVTVIDAENFKGYEDTSPTAKMQAAYTDIILIVGTTA
jgi:hypothetical protein